MGLMRWLATRFPNVPLHHVSSITVDAGGIRCRRVNGTRAEVRWDQVNRVMIRTTDRGPFEEDVFFVLETTIGTFVIPQEATANGDLLGGLQPFPGFDYEAAIEAMKCTDNREFVCWQRTLAT